MKKVNMARFRLWVVYNRAKNGILEVKVEGYRLSIYLISSNSGEMYKTHEV